MEKFTVIILHYNQINYLNGALLSVLNQNYPNIELIIADDCSNNFDKKSIEKFIKNNNKNNYSYKILNSKKNVGTVKNINNALKEVTGNYILFFAADDELYDENVITNFVTNFKDNNKNVITSQCIMYDKDLKKKYNKFVKKYKALKLNKKTSMDIYAKMALKCRYAAGATAYRKSVFDKYGKFDEKYVFVEDLSYFLKILREGEKIYYIDFNTLCHRDGGISHFLCTKDTISPHIKQYYTDMLNIYENEIFPYMDKLSLIVQYIISSRYMQQYLHYSNLVPELLDKKIIFDNLKRDNKKLKFIWKLMFPIRCFRDDVVNRIRSIIKFNRILLETFIIWLLVNIIFINNLSIENLNILLLIYILNYFIIYIVVSIFNNSLKFISKVKNGGLNV